MTRQIRVSILGVACLAFGATFLHAAAKSDEPLWAYGFPTPPFGSKAPPPQNPPVPQGLRPNQDPVEQMRIRHVDGSRMGFSLVDAERAWGKLVALYKTALAGTS